MWKRVSSREIWCPMERSKTRLLTRDMAGLKEVDVKVTSELLNQTTPTPFGFIGSRGSDDCHTSMSANPHNPVHDHNTSRHNNAPMIHAFLLFPMHSFLRVSHSYALLFFFGLHSSPIQPLWLRSILIRCSTRLVFSRKRPYWMVLMPVYVETAESLVKPLVILPAAVMPLSSLSLFSHDVIVPFVLADSFISHDPLPPRYLYKSFPHSLSPLFSYRLTTIGNTSYLWQNSIVKDSSWPLSYFV